MYYVSRTEQALGCQQSHSGSEVSQTRNHTRDPVRPSIPIRCNTTNGCVKKGHEPLRRKSLTPLWRLATNADVRVMNLQSLVLQVWLQTHTCAESHVRPREKTQIPQVTWKKPSWEGVSSMASSHTTHVCAQRTCRLHRVGHCSGTFVSKLIR